MRSQEAERTAPWSEAVRACSMWSMAGSLSLTRRIVVSVALGLGLILLLFGVVAAWTIQESIEAAYRERVALAQAVAWHVDAVIRYAQATLQREADHLALTPDRPLTDDQRLQLAQLRRQVSTFASLAVSDVEGTIRWTDARPVGPADDAPPTHPCRGLALRASEAQMTGFSSPLIGETERACLAVPVRGPTGRLAGVLMAELDPVSGVLPLLPSGELGAGMQVELVDSHARPLVSNRGRPPARSGAAHQPLLAAFIAARTVGYSVHASREWGETDSHLVAYAPLSTHASWGVVVEQPADLVMAVPRRLTWRLGLFGFAALCLAAAVAWLDVRRVVRPLKQLTAVAGGFAAGQLDEPVLVHRTDELGILARALETMRQRLRASLAEVAEWNHELEQRVAARTAEVEARSRELAHLNAIAETVTGSLDVIPMLDRTLERVLGFTGAEVGCIGVADGTGAGLKLAAERGLSDLLRTEIIAAGHALDGDAGWRVARAGDDGVAAPGASVCRAAGLGAWLTVPLLSGEGLQGLLFLGARQPGRFVAQERASLLAIGRQVGMALANARLYANLRTRERERAELLQRVIAGQEEERRRLAQELHDDASQALASLQLGLERLAAGTMDLADATQLAGQLQRIAAQTLVEVHRLAVELRPSVLDDIGLVVAIERYVQAAARRWGFATDFAAVGADACRLIPAAEAAIYRIVQAAVTNVAQHAQARHVSVLIQRRAETLLVVVEDDGRGFDLAAVHAAGLETRLGLAGMEERAALIGATLTFETAPGAGTTVFLEVPLGPNSRKEDCGDEAAHRAR
jgi:signal transduction histidine kinase